MTYSVGTTVIHPHHGAAKIVAKTKRPFNGKNVSYLELEITTSTSRIDPGMKILVVEDNADDIGLRLAASEEDAQEVLNMLSDMKNARMPSNWSRRFKNHTGMLATGDIYQVATVVRNLHMRTSGSRLSAGERSMQTKAEKLLASELAVTWKTTVDDALERIHATLEEAVKALPEKEK
jgi:CarD family transcriptional regulator